MGILPDNPNYTPVIPWGPFSNLPVWWLQAKLIKPKRPGRPRMTIPLIAKAALAWVKMPHGTPFSRAIEQVADEQYPDSDSAVENVRRQLAREAKRVRREKMRERGGILGN